MGFKTGDRVKLVHIWLWPFHRVREKNPTTFGTVTFDQFGDTVWVTWDRSKHLGEYDSFRIERNND